MTADYWLLPPDEPLDPKKFKRRRLDPDEYDAMHTALNSINKMTQWIGPEKLKELVGATDITRGKDVSLPFEKIAPPIYRTQPGGDRWGCRDCKDKGDKWYMQDHHCSRSKVEKLSWFRIKQGQRKASRIKILQIENERIGLSRIRTRTFLQ